MSVVLGIDLVMATRSFCQHARRTVMLGATIALVTTSSVLLFGLVRGIESAVFASSTALLSGHVNVGGFYRLASGAAAPLVLDVAGPLAIVRSLPDLERATLRGRGYARAVASSGSMELVLAGVDIEEEAGLMRVLELSSGDLGALAGKNTILLFAGQAARLGVRAGDELTLSAPTGAGLHNTVDVRVVAVVRELGLLSSFTTFVSNDTMRELYGYAPSGAGAIHLYLKDPRRAAAVAATLRAKLAREGHKVLEQDSAPYWRKLTEKMRDARWTGQRLDVTTWEDEVSFVSFGARVVAALGALLMAVLLAVIVLGIMNTMWVAVAERTREIGTLRAIGMSRAQVMRQLLLEAHLLALLGAAVGLVLGAALVIGITALKIQVPEGAELFFLTRSWVLDLELGASALIAAFVVMTATLAAVPPAWRASRLAPKVAMERDG